MKKLPIALLSDPPSRAVLNAVKKHQALLTAQTGKQHTQAMAVLDLIKKGLVAVGLL